MSEQKTPVQQKLARIKVAFCAQLPDRIKEGRRLIEALKAEAGAADHTAAAALHRLFHNLKGTANSLDFKNIGALAADAASYCHQLSEADNTTALSGAGACLGAWLDQLEQITAVSASPELENFEDSAFASVCVLSDTAKAPPFDTCLVYICDDEAELVAQLTYQLTCFGYQVESFSTPRSLCRTFAQKRPNALIMDIHFPEGARSEIQTLFELACNCDTPIPVIIISERNDFEARLQAVRAGGEAYFNKPVETLELLAALDNLTGRHRPEPYRVLVLDDDVDVARYHCLILREAGMQTCYLTEPEHTLELLQDFHPDIVLMDMYMPVCTGNELAALIRQLPEYVGMPIVYLSSETDRQKQLKAMRAGAEGFMTKPVVPEELVAAVSIRAERMRTLRSLMARDSLTGLYNHTTTTDLLGRALLGAKREGRSVCMVMIDLDRFKAVNDTYGHPVGDQVIIALARMLRQRLRSSDIIGRYGGEEFAVIMADTSVSAAGRIIDSLRKDFARFVFTAGGIRFSSTFSAGIAGYPARQTVELLREAADRALYEAKHKGRNRVVLDESMNDACNTKR